MKGNILIVTASPLEALAFRDLEGDFHGWLVETLITGIGTIASTRSLTRYFLQNQKPALALNAGIAGSFRDDLPVGSVGLVGRDCFADFGIDDRGVFIPAAGAGLVDENENPFDERGWIECKTINTVNAEKSFRILTGITSDIVSGSRERIDLLKKRFNPDIESMEGATFLYICALEKVPCLALRAVSNMIEERNRDNWDIPLALRNMREKAEELLTLLANTE